MLKRAIRDSAANRGPDHERTRAFEGYLAVAYERNGELDKGERLLRKNLEQVRRERPWSTTRTASVLSHLTANLLKQGRYAEVEPLARESLKLFEASTLHLVGEWKRFHAMSQLGEALVGQRRYADAERLVVQGYEGMKQREWTIQAPVRDRLAEAAACVIRLYEATERLDQARAFRAKWEN